MSVVVIDLRLLGAQAFAQKSEFHCRSDKWLLWRGNIEPGKIWNIFTEPKLLTIFEKKNAYDLYCIASAVDIFNVLKHLMCPCEPSSDLLVLNNNNSFWKYLVELIFLLHLSVMLVVYLEKLNLISVSMVWCAVYTVLIKDLQYFLITINFICS